MPVQFPAFCPNCGLIFESRLIRIEGSVTNLTLSGNREQCPRCKSWAELPDGRFNVADDTIEVVAASGLTRERLKRLARILDEARSGAMSDEEAVRAVTEEAPSLAPLLTRLQPRMKKAAIVFLWALFQILLSQGISELRNTSATKADVTHAVEQAVRYCTAQRP